jgi:hypothetical protein
MADIERRCGKEDRRLAVVGVVLVGLSAAMLCYIFLDVRSPLYSAAIVSVSGLDDGDLGRLPTDLSPLFNLTLRVTTRSLFSRSCTHTGAVVQVTYAGVKLAAAPVQRFCAKPRRTNEQAVVAWGTGVQAPGFRARRPRRGRAARGAGVRYRGSNAGEPRELPPWKAGVVHGPARRGWLNLGSSVRRF